MGLALGLDDIKVMELSPIVPEENEPFPIEAMEAPWIDEPTAESATALPLTGPKVSNFTPPQMDMSTHICGLSCGNGRCWICTLGATVAALGNGGDGTRRPVPVNLGHTTYLAS